MLREGCIDRMKTVSYKVDITYPDCSEPKTSFQLERILKSYLLPYIVEVSEA